MELASSPSLTGLRFAPATDTVDRGTLRLLAPHEANAASFVAQWNDLVARASEPNPFFEPWFLLPSLRHCGQNNRVLIKAYYSGERLCGLMPIIRSIPYYGYPIAHASGWLHANAFCGVPLIEAGQERAFWRAVLAHFDKRARRALFLHLPEMPEKGPVNTALLAVLAECDRQAVIVERAQRAMLASQCSPDEYFAKAMSTKKRKELRRQRKRLGELGDLALERISGPESLPEWGTEFLALEEAGWKGASGSALASSNDTRAFFTETLCGAAQAGRLERVALRLNGKPIAMLASFVTPPGVFSFKTAFDEAYARFSPGLLLQLENLDMLDRPDIDWADSCAVEGHSMIERIWREKRSIVSCNIAIGGPVRRFIFSRLMAYETRGRTSK